MNYEASYPAILEFMLPKQYRVLNLGLNGYGLLAATEKSQSIADIFPPDIVIYLATENDYREDQEASTYAGASYLRLRFNDLRNWFRRHSYLGSFVHALRWQVIYSKSINVTGSEIASKKIFYQANEKSFQVVEYNGISDPELGQKSKQTILKYNNYLTERGIPFIVIAHESGEVAQDLFAFCREQNIPSYLVHTPKSFKLVRDNHFNHLGNYKMAEFIYRNLAEQSWVQ
ncbi:hypothetical protein ACFL17_03025 [Pseudomonadota bacterium]